MRWISDTIQQVLCANHLVTNDKIKLIGRKYHEWRNFHLYEFHILHHAEIHATFKFVYSDKFIALRGTCILHLLSTTCSNFKNFPMQKFLTFMVKINIFGIRSCNLSFVRYTFCCFFIARLKLDLAFRKI